jgi:hypothetical protein
MHLHCSESAGGGKVSVSSKVTFSGSFVITVSFNIGRGDDNCWQSSSTSMGRGLWSFLCGCL